MFDRYYSFGYNNALRYSSNKEDAKEILSNAFLRAFKKLSLFDTSKAFEPWFARIIIHSSSDFYRYKKDSFYEIDEGSISNLEEDFDVLDKLSYEELVTILMKLSPAYRAVFNLYVIDGYKHKEIAQLLDISEGTSKSNLSKAKKQLQITLNKEYGISRI